MGIVEESFTCQIKKRALKKKLILVKRKTQ